MVRRTRDAVGFRTVALIPLLLVVFGAVLSCTDILGIDTDYDENPCNTEEASGLAPIECYKGMGACHVLIDACDELGLPASCPAFEPQEKDLCNDGLDNDCDEAIDEDECPCEDLDEDGQINSKSCYPGSPATRGVGACQDGVQFCQSGIWSSLCEGAVLPDQEKCDNLDNDCDGEVDEGCPCNLNQTQPCYLGPESTLNVGACSAGTQSCNDGVWGKCIGGTTPKVEVCDGVDNDCNGVVDVDSDACECVEGDQEECYTGPPNTLIEGAACRMGLRTCVGGKYSDTAECEGEVVPSAEICDGLDNDCNGLTDEGIPDIGLACTSMFPGDCQPGTYICTTDGLFCQPDVQPGDHVETCNGEDDDCDGDTDEGPFCCDTDNVQSGNETDVNCGGSCPTKCQNGRGCVDDDDCESNSCVNDTCVPPECNDGSLNGDETDIDCGGTTGCARCQVGDLCDVDSDCITQRCDPNGQGINQCAPKDPGEPCMNGDECASTYCVDGFCCNSQCNGTCQACSAQKKGNGGADGICEAIVDGADPDNECALESPSTCGSTGVCNGFGACRLYSSSTTCNQPTCAGPTASNTADYCNGVGVCVDSGVQSCGTYACNAATGLCFNNCSSDAQCAGDAYCSGATCVSKLPTGQFCNTANECQSGFCVDGFCCNSACANACDVCSAQLGAASNGTCTNAAGYAGNPACDGHLCSAAQPTCPSICTSNAGCAATHYCDSAINDCVPKLALGFACAAGSQCQSGSCVDGYCCNSACSGACDVCSAQLGAQANGTCTNAAGYVGNPSCGNYVCSSASQNCPLTCTNDSVCALGNYCSSATSTCVSKLVTGSACQSSNQCDSGYCVDGFCCDSACSGNCDVCSAALGAQANGICTNAAGYVGNPPCNGFVCTGTSPLCPGACTNDGQCGSGYYCSSSNTCVLKLTIGQACSTSNQCDSGFCVDGFCCNTDCAGSCNVCAASKGASANGACTNITGAGEPSCSPYTCTGTSNACPNGCTTDAQCEAGRYCSSPSCLLKLGQGSPCGANNQCSTGFCVDGVCCNTDCAGSCNVCSAALGGSTDGVCTNVGPPYPGNPSCAPYLCSASSALCPQICTGDAQCSFGNYCNASNNCVPKLVIGSACSTANQCETGNCVDGVCCNSGCSGSCDVCSAALGASANGNCTNIAGAGSPSCSPYACTGFSSTCPATCLSDAYCAPGNYCNALNNCVPKLSIGTACTTANQCQTGNCVDGYCCNSECSGSCNVCAQTLGASSNGTCTNIIGPGSPTCAPYVCTGSSGGCPQSCSSDLQCALDSYCQGTSCVAKKPLGALCGASNECQSGACADGVCCTSTCAGSCNACTVALGASQDGTCDNVTGGGNPSCGAYVCSGTSSSCPSSCTMDSQCSAGNYCNGTSCVPKKSQGSLCGGANECASGFCADGRCCNEACDESCESCNGAGTCVADGAGSPGAPVSCSPYVCDGSLHSCPMSCTADAHCATGNFCSSGACVPKLGPGAACGGANECASGFCADGVCCNEACDEDCESCNALGACVADAVGSPGSPNLCAPYLCDGATHSCPPGCMEDSQCTAGSYCDGSACQFKKPQGELCGAGKQCQSGFCADGVCCNEACDESCESCNALGACVADAVGSPGAPVSCSPYVCDGTAHSCPLDCSQSSECAADHYCDTSGSPGACVPVLPFGDPCSDGGQCDSGFCADGVCCDSACDGECESCNALGACVLSGAGTAGDPSCAPYVCDGVLGACPIDCGSDSDCVSGYYCNGSGSGTCVAQQANGTACTAGSQCTSGNCVEGLCCGSCGAGQWCDSTGTCRDPVVLMVGGNLSELIGASYHPGGAWSSPTVMPVGASLGSDVTISRAGGVAVARPLSGNLGYATWNVGTEAWAHSSLSVASLAAPAISAFGSSARMIYLHDGNPPVADTFHAMVFSGGSWGGSDSTTVSPPQPVPGDIAHLADGSAVLVYADNKDIKAISYDGTSWTGGTTIDNGSSGNIASGSGPTIIALEGGTAELMAVFVHSDKLMYSKVRSAGTWSMTAQQIGGATDTTTHRVAVAPLPGGGVFAAYRGEDGLLYTSVYTPGPSPSWSTPVAFQAGSPLATVPIIFSPAVARGTGAGVNAAEVELAYILDGASVDTMHHVRCTSLSSGACVYTTAPVQVSATNVAVIAIASRP